ncbi:hypothetical protein FN976_17260 [Caenimonas sedimenti]|uniref:STAS/SEC14 domain-containing protein n=1 Tax=Caenimonas sedimenti TaxID=2596921 RepID=A0A562ZP46_9BURK|nr:hypothetical protein [Caenimonas sedimenti]TWO70085.1 hypothetical protein FN976_17260 [Caenimonas sedimenti]
MSLELNWEHHDTHAVVRLVGTPQLGHVLSALEVIAIECAGIQKLLVDLRGISTLQSFTDQFALGQAAATKLNHLHRIASVVPVGRKTRNSERPAREGGLDLRVFESEEQALSWLLVKVPSPES